MILIDSLARKIQFYIVKLYFYVTLPIKNHYSLCYGPVRSWNNCSWYLNLLWRSVALTMTLLISFNRSERLISVRSMIGDHVSAIMSLWRSCLSAIMSLWLPESGTNLYLFTLEWRKSLCKGYVKGSDPLRFKIAL